MPPKSEAISATIPQMVVQSAIDLIALQSTSKRPWNKGASLPVQQRHSKHCWSLGCTAKTNPTLGDPKGLFSLIGRNFRGLGAK